MGLDESIPDFRIRTKEILIATYNCHETSGLVGTLKICCSTSIESTTIVVNLPSRIWAP